MTEGKKSDGSIDPTELWKQWYETSSKMWAKAVEEGKETYVDTYSLYQAWLKNFGQAQEQLQAKALEMMNPREIWNSWYEATVGAWRKAAEAGGDPLGLTTQWLELMEETRKRIMNEDILPADPVTFFREWYEATSQTWAKVVDDVISSEKFIKSASPFLEVYATFVKTLRRANEEYFSNLQLPTRADLARVAELVITLEEKVDKIEDAFEDLEEERSQGSHLPEAVESLEARLGRVENKLDTLSAALAKSEAARTAGGTGDLTKRLDTVEGKLDKVLATLGKTEARKPTTTTARRTTSQKKAE